MFAAACDGSSEFTCDDRQCVGSYDVCDDESDCADGSDENGCGNPNANTLS